MKLDNFFAMRSGAASQCDGAPTTLRVVPLGPLHISSGLLEACDPFTGLGDGPVFPVPVGDHPVFATIADLSGEHAGSNDREAYLSIVLAEGAVSRLRAAGNQRERLLPGEFYAVGVDSGTVGFVDHQSVETAMPDPSRHDWFAEIFDSGRPDSWFSLMDSPDHIGPGLANVAMPLATGRENVVLSHSGWGDGIYPVLGTYTADGTLLGLHIDLFIVGDTADQQDS